MLDTHYLKNHVFFARIAILPVFCACVFLYGCIHMNAGLSATSFRAAENSHSFHASYDDVWEHVISYVYAAGKPNFVDPDTGFIQASIEQQTVTVRIIPVSIEETHVIVTQTSSKKSDLRLPEKLFQSLTHALLGGS